MEPYWQKGQNIWDSYLPCKCIDSFEGDMQADLSLRLVHMFKGMFYKTQDILLNRGPRWVVDNFLVSKSESFPWTNSIE